MKAFLALLCAALLIAASPPGARAEPAAEITAEPSIEPSIEPSVEPSIEPSPVASVAPAAGRELSGYYGGDIARAAAELGGLTFSAGEEYSENYDGPTLTLRGQGGRVTMIELKDAPGGDSLCGVTAGMTRAEVEMLTSGCPVLWQFDEELAFTMRTDARDELNNETLVVFLDEEGRVNGAWYRAGN